LKKSKFPDFPSSWLGIPAVPSFSKTTENSVHRGDASVVKYSETQRDYLHHFSRTAFILLIIIKQNLP
jgi:hypothetical protein